MQELTEIWNSVNFPNKINDSEQILFIIRKHTSVITDKLQKSFGIVLLIIVVRLFFSNFFSNPAWAFFFDTLLYGSSCIFLCVFAYFFHNYYLSFLAVTNYRIISTNQINLFFADVQEVFLANVQSVDLKIEKARNVVVGRNSLVLTTLIGEHKGSLTIFDISDALEIRQKIQNLIGR
jgi:hypothetical protein